MTEKADEIAAGFRRVAPVFHGLTAVGVTGKDMATALRVSTASVSKWRNGRVAMPDETKVFLTLMLGDQITRVDEFGEDTIRVVKSAGGLEIAKADLAKQEQLNRSVPAMAVREGVRRYRIWWNALRNAAHLIPNRIVGGLETQIKAAIR